MILNPYERLSGQWIRGNFHGHSSEHSSCASVPLDEGLARYAELGLQFSALTDHDWITDLAESKTQYPELILLSGFEHSSSANLLFVGESVPPLYEVPLRDAVAQTDGQLLIACHPRPRSGDFHWSRKKLLRLPKLPDGIEIINGHYGVPKMLARGCNPRYTRFWDDLLSRGLRVWGFANDDSHDPPDYGNAFNMVHVDERTPDAVIRSAKAGRFYASTGLIARSIIGNGGEIRAIFDTPCTGRFIGPGGRVIHESNDTEFRFELIDESYIRFEAISDDGELFLQPLFGYVNEGA